MIRMLNFLTEYRTKKKEKGKKPMFRKNNNKKD